MLMYVTHNYLDRAGYSGIKKKIMFQVKALESHFGTVCYTMRCEGMVYLINGTQVIDKKAATTREMTNEAFCVWLDKYQVDKTYIRYEYSSNPWFLRFLERQKERDVRSVLEIPTYPYDQEIRNDRLKIEEEIFREDLPRYVDRISTYSNDRTIWGIPCINLVNGVDLESNPLRKRKKADGKIVLIGVSSLSPWHGYDRVIMGLRDYYKNGGDRDLLFKLVGTGIEEHYYRALVEQYDLQEHVEFCGRLKGEELNLQHDLADIAVGSLGLYRVGAQFASPIKGAEYCARGLPIIVGYEDPRFPCDLDYVMRVSNNSEPLNMGDVINFYHKTASQAELSTQMRQYAAEHLTWDRIMQTVVEYLKAD